MVSDTCKHLGRTLEEFDIAVVRDIEALDHRYDEELERREAGEGENDDEDGMDDEGEAK